MTLLDDPAFVYHYVITLHLVNYCIDKMCKHLWREIQKIGNAKCFI